MATHCLARLEADNSGLAACSSRVVHALHLVQILLLLAPGIQLRGMVRSDHARIAAESGVFSSPVRPATSGRDIERIDDHPSIV